MIIFTPTGFDMKTAARKIFFTAIILALPLITARAADIVSLAGKWNFQLDPADQGITNNWPARTGALPDTIKLPGTTDEAGFGTVNTNVEVGVLSRRYKYYGPAWYRREITVPAAWQNRDLDLFLERVIWQSRVWVDGRPRDSQESLNTPHVHHLGRLTPGRHVLMVRIDNRPLHPIGINGHSYTEQTQTIWNGAVGRIELQARDTVHIAAIRVFPDAAHRQAAAELTLQNDDPTAQPATVLLQLHKRGSHQIIAETETNFTVAPGSNTVPAQVTLARSPDLWDEFSPNLYTLDVTVKAAGTKDSDSQTFGFRAVSRIGQHIAINGRPVFLRGNLDNLNFPLTGYPAMNVDGWKRLFNIYKSYGLNHVRYHTWTPPEAAFIAADELGIYIQAEVIWVQRPLGNDVAGSRMEGMNFGSFPEELRTPPGTIDNYVHDEMRRVMNAYGNHPSFVLFTIGNEMGHYDHEVCDQWLKDIKTYDPRRFYAITTARRISPEDDFSVTHAIPNVGWCRDTIRPANNWDYETIYAQAPVPIIAHEVGQWPAFPTWDEIGKYTGVLRARNYEHFRDLAETNGVANLDHAFRAASGAVSQRLYKDEIESHLRTADCSGFDLLSIQDYSGQGEALVGWLDSFYDSKGIVTPERFRRWCSPTVPLARLDKYIYESGETLTARVDVAHYGPAALDNITASWSLRDRHGKILGQGKLAPATLPLSSVTTLGSFTAPLGECTVPYQARLEVKLDGTAFANDWDIWVYPAASTPDTGNVVVCDDLTAALNNLHDGRKVLFDAHQFGTKDNASYAKFKPAYWSAWMFQGQYTLGALVHQASSALAQFPTGDHYDWQWEELCRTGRGFRLDGLPLAYQPIVQPIGDFHFGWKLGTVFELRVGTGQLLVCGYDVSSRLEQRPAARQLRTSLLAYMNSPAFAPRTEASAALLAKMIPLVRTAPIAMPTGFANAVLYVKAGAKDTAGGDVPWKTELDDAKITEAGFGYNVECNAIWKDGEGTAWWSDSTLRLHVRIPTPRIYDLYIHFHDWNDNGRAGKIKFAGREYELGAHTGKGKWVKLEVLREDCLDGQITVEAIPTSGPNLQVTALALVPR